MRILQAATPPRPVSHARRLALLLAAAALAGVACGGGGSDAPPPAPVPAPAPPPAQPAFNADITVLMIGNSHTVGNDLPVTLGTMVRAGRGPGRTVAVAVAPGSMFLDEHLAHAPTTTLLASQRWTFVILQAQKYSTSGLFTYSTAEAEELIRRARAQGAVPVMFPEWPRLGVDETQRIFDLHVTIARRESACVAPIGQAWDLARARHPALVLHAADGNHAAPAGAFLTALVLYATLTGGAPGALPTLAVAGVDATTQEQLRSVASDTVLATAPRTWCPNDPY